MAKEDYQKKLVGYAVLSNNSLDKIAMATEETHKSVVKIENTIIRGVSISEKISKALDKQTTLLVEIRDLLKNPSAAQGGKTSDTGMKKLGRAGGLIALMGLGLLAFIGIFKMADGVSMRNIATGIGIAVAMIPISKAFSEVIKYMPTKVIAQPGLMSKIMIGLVAMSVGYALIAVAMGATPMLTPGQMVNSIAIAGVFYVVGTIFAKLLEAFRYRGLFGMLANRGRITQTMASMVIMAASLAVIAFAMRFAPRVTPQHALSFTIASFALIPLAIAFKQLKWVFVLSRKFTVRDVQKTTLMIGIVALALIPLGFAAQLIPAVSPAVAKTLFNLALILIPIAVITNLIMSAINKTGEKGIMDRVLGPAAPKPVVEKKKKSRAEIIKSIATWTLVTIGIFLSLALISRILAKSAPAFQAIEGIKVGPLLKLIAVVGIAGIVVSLIIKIMKGGSSSESGGFLGIIGGKTKTKTGKLSVNDMIMAAIALPLIAMGLVMAAYVFQALPAKLYAPTLSWAWKASLSLLLFALPFAAITKLIPNVKTKTLLMGLLTTAVLSLSILAVSYAFSMLGNEYKAPPVQWAISAAIAITIFAIPLAVIGAIATSGVGAAGILLGAAGMILIAGTMWVVSWIFSKLPDLSAISKNFTDALMYPVNAMIDSLVRLKNEIGIENMIPLAGGLLAIAGGWLALTAALAGTAVGGLIQGVANVGTAILDGISGLFGGGKTKSPIDLLDMLIARSEGIKALANPVKELGKGFAQMTRFTESVIRSVTAFSPFLDGIKAQNFTKSANAATILAKAYSSMAASSKLMNVPALQASARMFEAIAEIAENKGQDAISELAESLMAAVKELSETVKNLEDASSGQQEGIKDAISGAMSSFIDKIKGKTDETGKETGLVDIEPIVLAIQELEERFDRAIKVQAI